ncbi:hypothetical protein NDI56_16785 [Haloarcula sp. S1CR25-12]|uniref:Hsp70 family protein n=1 Tax=Haloarcula saliterrae TaxID=2950534 RepID=A0ABU2FFL6_9EURY|nr:hypothetical protein [Haloarcula sp. S1CR25-12]MDS0261056.1 hypothetical protein [Haloarcula sp. S1CR25-12]
MDRGHREAGMIFGLGEADKDPVIGVDIGSSVTYLGGLEPDNSGMITITGSDGKLLVPTEGAILGEEIAAGTQAGELLDRGADVVDILTPFMISKETRDGKLPPLDHGQPGAVRREFFEHLYTRIETDVDGWEGRIAIPFRPWIDETNRDLLEEFLRDAGFDVVCRLSSPVATAIGYWEHHRIKDPHYSQNPREGAVLLTVDMGATFIDAAVISVDHSQYRQLSLEASAFKQTWERGFVSQLLKTKDFDVPSHELQALEVVLERELSKSIEQLLTKGDETVQIRIPEVFTGAGGEVLTISSSTFQRYASLRMEGYNDRIQEALSSAGLDSLEDIDIVITGGFPARTVPVLHWWSTQGADWGTMSNPNETVDSNAKVRITGGFGGKTLPSHGASALANSEVGHTKSNIKIQ